LADSFPGLLTQGVINYGHRQGHSVAAATNRWDGEQAGQEEPLSYATE
jgi:hypothetical protein